MNRDTSEILGEWSTVSMFLSTACELHEFLKGRWRKTLSSYGKSSSVRVPNTWTLGEKLFFVESYIGSLGISLDPLGCYLRSGKPCVWVIAEIGHLEALRKYLEDGRTFGTHIYFDWDAADGKWDFAMHPVSEAAALMDRLRELESQGHEVNMDSLAFMDHIPVDRNDLPALEPRVPAAVERAAATLGLRPKR